MAHLLDSKVKFAALLALVMVAAMTAYALSTLDSTPTDHRSRLAPVVLGASGSDSSCQGGCAGGSGGGAAGGDGAPGISGGSSTNTSSGKSGSAGTPGASGASGSSSQNGAAGADGATGTVRQSTTRTSTSSDSQKTATTPPVMSSLAPPDQFVPATQETGQPAAGNAAAGNATAGTQAESAGTGPLIPSLPGGDGGSPLPALPICGLGNNLLGLGSLLAPLAPVLTMLGLC